MAIKINIKDEALMRMQMLNLDDNVIDEFEKSIVYVSTKDGELIKADDEIKILIDSFEKEHNALVYHVIVSDLNFGKCINLLFVDDAVEDWNFENNSILYGRVSAYVKNAKESWRSEFGMISVISNGGALVRIS